MEIDKPITIDVVTYGKDGFRVDYHWDKFIKHLNHRYDTHVLDTRVVERELMEYRATSEDERVTFWDPKLYLIWSLKFS